MRPEEAVQAARAEAARRRAAGGYAIDVEPGALVEDEGVDGGRRTASRAQLLEWALIEPDPGLVRSTRRYGAPITWAKRGLVHVLRQYFTEAHAQQTRFNLHMVAAWTDLEARVARVEAAAGTRREAAPSEDAPREAAPREDAPAEDAPREAAPSEDAPREDAP